MGHFARSCLAILVLLASAHALDAGSLPAPPPAPRDTTVDVLHGVAVADPYRWLEDLSAAKTHAWIAAQQRYTQRLLGRQQALPLLKRELEPLMRLNTPEAVIYRHGHTVLLKKTPGEEVASLYLRRGLRGTEQRLVDARGVGSTSATTLDLLSVSRDGRIVAYGVRHGGADQLSIHFLDLMHHKELPDVLPQARYIYWSLLLAPDDTAVYYIKFGSHGPRLYVHHFGQTTPDRRIFGHGLGVSDILQATLSQYGRFLLIQVLHGATGPTDLYLKGVRSQGPARALVKGKSANFVARAAGGHIYIRSDLNAPRGQIMVTDEDHPGLAYWRILVPQSNDTLLRFALSDGKLVLHYMHDAHSRLEIFDPASRQTHTIGLPGLGTVEDLDGSWNSAVLTFGYSSFSQPRVFMAYSVKDGRDTLISGPRRPRWLAKIVTEQVWYHSKDGTRVPMFLVHRAGLRRDGTNPVLLYGYGGFDWAQTPSFSPEAAVWVENGGIYALANIRGGNEFGEAWHTAGDLLNKQNSFDDFAAAARWLVRAHYTTAKHLAIQGMSNGGLLVLASITQHPRLFGAAIARYALADMLRYERFGIARWWVGEYGSVKNAAQFKAILAYSPYQHVKPGTPYPAVLLVTGADDTRVSPAHSFKMTAALQNAASSGKPILLLYDSKSGHSGTLPVNQEVNQMTHELAFLDWQLGTKKP